MVRDEGRWWGGELTCLAPNDNVITVVVVVVVVVAVMDIVSD